MKITRTPHSKAKLPVNKKTQVWMYMDFWKFESILQKKALHLCRSDKLQDQIEGTYSRQQITDINKWLEDKGYEKQAIEEEKNRQIIRRKFFVSCWCMSTHDLDLMWKAYTSNILSVAIQSTVERLESIVNAEQAIEYWPLDLSIITYLDHINENYIDYIDGFETIVKKDIHFELDREIRIIHSKHNEPFPEEIYIPVDLNILIEKIVLRPGFNAQSINSLARLLGEAQISDLQVEISRYERILEE